MIPQDITTTSNPHESSTQPTLVESPNIPGTPVIAWGDALVLGQEADGQGTKRGKNSNASYSWSRKSIPRFVSNPTRYDLGDNRHRHPPVCQYKMHILRRCLLTIKALEKSRAILDCTA